MLINSNTDIKLARAQLSAQFDLQPSIKAAEKTQHLYDAVKHVITHADWCHHAPYILAIEQLKREKDAVILAHNYMTPEIFHGVADIRGDSLQLAVEATKVSQAIIVQCGVHFMAETSKILNPQKTVLIPDNRAGCSLASSITAADIDLMRQAYPGASVVSYVNTTAEVKAASDVCCTSSNALQIVESMPGNTVIMTPDGYLAQNVAKLSSKKIVYWQGACEVHERFTAEEIRAYRAAHPGIKIIAHPECPPDVVAEADFTGSTSGMISWAHQHKPQKLLMVTECSMSDNVASALPEVDFIRPCYLCPHMKRISLENILWCLYTQTEKVEVAAHLIEPAREAVNKMIELSKSQFTPPQALQHHTPISFSLNR